MAQVDALRFLSRISLLFAPDIQDGQQFVAYIDEDNSFTVQADNVIRTSGGGAALLPEQVEEIEQRLTSLQTQADSLESFCLNIPGLQAQIQTLSGSNDDPVDFAYAYLVSEIREIKSEMSILSAQVAELNDDVIDLQNQ